MTNIHSHIKSIDHFNELWNNKINLFADYFTNTPLIAFLYKFGFTSFIRNLSDSLLSLRDPMNDTYIETYKRYYNYNTNEFINDYNTIYNSFIRFEPRKKTISAQKLNDFINDYNQLSKQDTGNIILPYQIEDFADIVFSDLYPSVRRSLESFMINNNIMYSNKKNTMLYVKTFSPNNDHLMEINSSASFILKSSFATNFVNFDKAIQEITNLVNSLMYDNAYLESKINQISKQLETKDKEGINGYLLTWH